MIGYTAFLPVQAPTPFGWRFAPSDLFLALYLGIMGTRIRMPARVWSPWLLALCVVILLGSPIALVRTGTLTSYSLLQKSVGILVLLGTFAMFVDASQRIGDRRILRLFVAFVVAHTMVALTAYGWVRFTGSSWSWINYADVRLAGFLIDPNAFGGLLVVTLTLLVTSLASPKPLVDRPWGWPLCLILLTGILLTFSRSAWLGLAAVMLGSLLLRPRLAAAFAGLAAVALASVASLGADVLGFVEAMTMRPTQIASRIELMYAALDTARSHPLVGAGTGVFLERHGEIVHSTAFWLLAETGLLGLGLFLGLVLWFVRRGLEGYRRAEEPGAATLVLALLLAHLSMVGISLGIEAFYQRQWWLVMGLLAITFHRIDSGERPTEADRLS